MTLADLAPELERRPTRSRAAEVLAWAGMPLATAEVAAVCDRDIADVRAELAAPRGSSRSAATATGRHVPALLVRVDVDVVDQPLAAAARAR